MPRWWPFDKSPRTSPQQLPSDPVDWSLGSKSEREEKISLLVQELQSPRPSRRARAVELLEEAKVEQAIPALMALLQGEEHLVVRWKVLHAIEQISGLSVQSTEDMPEMEAWRKEAVDELIEQLGSEKASQRWGAAEALGRLGDRKAVPALVEGLRDPHAFVRWSAAQALGQIGGETAIPMLLPLLQEKDPLVRRSAVDALGYLDNPTARKSLHQALHDPDPSVLRNAIEATAQLGESSAVDAVIRALEQCPDLWVRYSAAEALGTIGDHRAIPPLMEVSRDRSEMIRRAAIRSLGLLQDSRAIPVLVQALEDSDVQVRLFAADGLAQIGHEGALPQLRQRLQDNASAFGRKVGTAAQQAIEAIQERIEKQTSP
jgi:HEAT repeat protein